MAVSRESQVQVKIQNSADIVAALRPSLVPIVCGP